MPWKYIWCLFYTLNYITGASLYRKISAKNPFNAGKSCKIAKIIVKRNGKTLSMTMQKWTPLRTFNKLPHVERS